MIFRSYIQALFLHQAVPLYSASPCPARCMTGRQAQLPPTDCTPTASPTSARHSLCVHSTSFFFQRNTMTPHPLPGVGLGARCCRPHKAVRLLFCQSVRGVAFESSHPLYLAIMLLPSPARCRTRRQVLSPPQGCTPALLPISARCCLRVLSSSVRCNHASPIPCQVYDWAPGAAAPTKLYACSVANQSEVLRQERALFARVSAQALQAAAGSSPSPLGGPAGALAVGTSGAAHPSSSSAAAAHAAVAGGGGARLPQSFSHQGVQQRQAARQDGGKAAAPLPTAAAAAATAAAAAARMRQGFSSTFELHLTTACWGHFPGGGGGGALPGGGGDGGDGSPDATSQASATTLHNVGIEGGGGGSTATATTAAVTAAAAAAVRQAVTRRFLVCQVSAGGAAAETAAEMSRHLAAPLVPWGAVAAELCSLDTAGAQAMQVGVSA